MFILILLWIYECGLNFYNNIYNLKANCRAYMLRTVFNNNVSALASYGKDGIWETIYDYNSEDTVYLIILYIRFKLGITMIRGPYYKYILDKKTIKNHKFAVVTSYEDGVKNNVIIHLDEKAIVTPLVNIGYAILGDVDITSILKAYQSSINHINISVSDFIVILRNKHELNIVSKEDAVLTIFNVDSMEEQTLKGDDIINI